LRCVIINDNPDFIGPAADVLERNGVRIVGATTDSAEALRCVERLAPDVTLIDVDRRVASGFEVAAQLHRRLSPEAASALILMSGHDGEEFADMIGESPARGFIPKLALSGEAIRALLPDG
jgi:DNA-binding NarL/FixJ family response regulator